MIPDKSLNEYLEDLVGKIYKILPLKESEIDTLNEYIKSLQLEIIGSLNIFDNDAKIMTVINTLQYFIDNEYDTKTCKREVFKCIKIVKKLRR